MLVLLDKTMLAPVTAARSRVQDVKSSESALSFGADTSLSKISIIKE
ncbi:hypothetical protein CAter282_0233 [Collimonas arenae]|uniref:Uncharacterized protein n=1 Tax=Collimonas arenae TaxID=279058 RepID=A0A127PKD1_9BURK|nr:hypothetical protein CAter10_0246 [Collimonas arenae]AMP08055.1 hypothetical protein CAter282_0233 [Collimonas arenae]